MDNEKYENQTDVTNSEAENITATETTAEYLTLAEENAKLHQEIMELKKTFDALKEQQKKLILATKVNTLKEQEIRNEEFKKYAVQRLIEDSILPVLLNFERALNYETSNSDVKNFLVGFRYIFNELKNTLAKEGLTTVEVQVGEVFNSHKAQVLEVEEVTQLTKDQTDNMITKVLTNGYKLHNRVISPAQVKIIKLKEDNETKKEN